MFRIAFNKLLSSKHYLVLGFAIVVAMSASTAETTTARADQENVRITSLYDAFGKPSPMKLDWGLSAYIEYRGKKILFDTGNNADIFAHNVKAKGIDLTTLDFAIISHRHGDHTSGLNHLISVNPGVNIYAPKENFGVFGAALPKSFLTKDESLPPEQRYFNGNPPEEMHFGSPWPTGNFTWIKETTEIAPGFHLILLKGPWGVDLDVMEASLAIETPQGIVLIVGCSHPKIENIVSATQELLQKPIHLVYGGYHLLPAKPDEIRSLATALRQTWHIDFVAPVHCTGEPAFKILKETFGNNYIYVGLGTTIDVGKSVLIKADVGQPKTFAMDQADFTRYRAVIPH